MRLLLIAYACEPGSGSEPGTGWNLALELSKRFEVTVVTRRNNQKVIESDPERQTRENLSFAYHDGSSLQLWLKKQRILSTQLYYYLWHRSLGRRMQSDSSLQNFDVAQHLTFNSFEVPPSALVHAARVKIWGPVGGGQTAPASLLPTMRTTDRWREIVRTWRVGSSARARRVKKMLECCDLVLFANEETRDLLAPMCKCRTEMMIDVGVAPERFFPSGKTGDGTKILSAGRIESRKGIRFLMQSFREALAERPDLHLKIVGSGPNLIEERAWVKQQGLEESIELVGKVSHREMENELRQADIFVFPSLRDTSGAIVLEAMASGLPIICLDHQGARLMVGDDAGVKVPLTSLVETMRAFAGAIVELSQNAKQRIRWGSNGRSRVVENFSWNQKAERLGRIYREGSQRHKNSNL